MWYNWPCYRNAVNRTILGPACPVRGLGRVAGTGPVAGVFGRELAAPDGVSRRGFVFLSLIVSTCQSFLAPVARDVWKAVLCALPLSRIGKCHVCAKDDPDTASGGAEARRQSALMFPEAGRSAGGTGVETNSYRREAGGTWIVRSVYLPRRKFIFAVLPCKN